MTRTAIQLAAIVLVTACVGDGAAPPPADDSTTEPTPEDTETTETTETEASTDQPLSCPPSPTTYTPYETFDAPAGTVSSFPWHGHATSYPGGIEDFRAYAASAMIECSNAKSTRSHLDVTAGCLQAVAIGAAPRARIESTSGGAFRMLALGFADDVTTEPLRWTDQSVAYRFFYTGTSGAGVDPGFKAFARYRDEYDLYVGSWRVDGVIQIKKKVCGTYTTLAQVQRTGPSTNAWHDIRFDVKGNALALYLDGERVLTATDDTFAWGTAGIRTDAMTGAYLADWRVQMPL